MSERVPNFIWPNNPDPDPSGVARFGRVLHWLFAGLAVATAVGGSLALRDEPEQGLAAIVLGFTAGFWFAGRALRYVFSGE